MGTFSPLVPRCDHFGGETYGDSISWSSLNWLDFLETGGNFGWTHTNLKTNAAEYFINLEWIWLSKDFFLETKLLRTSDNHVTCFMSKQYFRYIK